MTDIEIARNAKLRDISFIAKELSIKEEELEFYGRYKAKLNERLYKRMSEKKDGKLILVTAINPTPAGEGKTTVTIGLGQAMNKIQKNAIVALREPSLGPVFGIKGGAAGGGYSQVLPMEDINLHFTGDMHAITSANNLLCAMIDNHIHQGNHLNIDQRKILFKRCMDINDRALRNIIVGLGGKSNGFTREDSFNITVASEVMAVLCLASDITDLKTKLGKMLVAYSLTGKPIYARDIKAENAMAILLKDAIMPNLVQTIEGTPALIHGGPFANIAHGCNSLRATKIALKLADYCITEAGFGSDLGAEKFFDIKCRKGKLTPNAVVIVCTVRAIKYNGTLENLGAHISNMKKFGVPVVVALNKFNEDTEEDISQVEKYCNKLGAKFSLCECFEKGGNGAVNLAKIVCELCENESNFRFLYDDSLKTKEKIEILSREIYGANGVIYSEKAEKSINEIEKLGASDLPICVAKTQYSLSDNKNLLGRPKNFNVTVRDVSLSNGAGFLVVLMGDIMTMPGLPKSSAAEKMFINEKFDIEGLF